MDEKQAFVFDTNFIIQNDATNWKKMEALLKPLKEKFNVYITQISINERIAQHQRILKEKFDKIPSLKKEYNGIVTLAELTTFDVFAQKEKICQTA